MNPLDCADAFQYYYGAEGTYHDVESAVFHNPRRAQCGSQDYRYRYQTTWRPPADDGGGDKGPSGPPLWSVVDQLRAFCALHPDDPALSWRSVTSYKKYPHDPAPPLRRCLYYMGPPHTMTCAALWANIEAFGQGLRSLGLKPSDPVGLMEDTRWEWLVTCYGCWSQGLVPVVFHGADSCLRRVAIEVLLRTKVAVCQRHVMDRLRRYIQEAVALHESYSGEGEGGRQKTREAPHRSAPPRPLFIVMRQSNIMDAQSTHLPCDTPRNDAKVMTDSSNPQHHRDESDEEEEALWWTEVLEYGKKIIFQRNARQNHQRRKPRSHVLTSLQKAYKYDEDNLIVNSPHSAKKQPRTVGVDAVSRRRDVQKHYDLTPNSNPSNTIEALPTSYESIPLAPASRYLALSSGGSTSGLVPLRSSDLALVVYTEGDPKGVLLTHGALAASVAGYRERFLSMQLFTPSFADDSENGNSDRHEEEDKAEPDKENLPTGEIVESQQRNTKYHHGKVESNEIDRSHTNQEKCGGQGYCKRIFQYLSTIMRTNPNGGIRKYLWRTEEPPSRRHAEAPTYLAYLPLHNVRELVLEMCFLTEGFLLCYGSNATLTNADAHPRGDLEQYKPLIFSAVPHTLDQLCRTVTRTLAEGLPRLLFEVGYEKRRQALRRGLDTPFLNEFIFGQPRQLLGGRCQLVLSCCGPLHPRTQEYLKVVCCVAVSQIYAPTEAGGCGVMQDLWVDHMRNIGGPLGPVEMKLRDVKQWNHRTVRPCGELLLGGPTIMAGYHCNPEKTAAVLENKGWLHTGDIVERLPDGTLRQVARLGPQNVNAMGCIMDVESLEAIYNQHPLCAARRDADSGGSVCVLVHPFGSYICALVLTDKPRTTAFIQDAATQSYIARASRAALKRGSRPGGKNEGSTRGKSQLQSWPHCLCEPLFNEAAAESLRELAMQHHCMSHELVHHVRVLYDEWTTQNGARTVTGRLERSVIEQRYQTIIEELFLWNA
ncbi:unnamed protein product [Phytomonas sp. Hart1]|nr:unnamed protein product [Phytomonas sp. Hart1]|eukprot:CCW71319.1 unnamed protein product [Phytomonas sp. isolate Hart1]